jgi:hypothetical protein
MNSRRLMSGHRLRTVHRSGLDLKVIRWVELSADVSYGSLATTRPADVRLTPQ